MIKVGFVCVLLFKDVGYSQRFVVLNIMFTVMSEILGFLRYNLLICCVVMFFFFFLCCCRVVKVFNQVYRHFLLYLKNCYCCDLYFIYCDLYFIVTYIFFSLLYYCAFD